MGTTLVGSCQRAGGRGAVKRVDQSANGGGFEFERRLVVQVQVHIQMNR